MHALSLAIIGSQHPNKRGPTRRFEMELCAPGEPVELRPEPKNPADENAIAVFSCRGVQLGYIPSVRAAWLIRVLGQCREVRAIFQGIGPTCGWCRVAFDGDEPVLPYERPANDDRGDDAGNGFWPDPIYDE